MWNVEIRGEIGNIRGKNHLVVRTRIEEGYGDEEHEGTKTNKNVDQGEEDPE